jgi:hypothetical protein
MITAMECNIMSYGSVNEQLVNQEFYEGPADYGFLVSIYFPALDINAIRENLAIG